MLNCLLNLQIVAKNHYANMSVQYTAIFHDYKNGNIQMKIVILFLVLLKT